MSNSNSNSIFNTEFLSYSFINIKFNELCEQKRKKAQNKDVEKRKEIILYLLSKK